MRGLLLGWALFFAGTAFAEGMQVRFYGRTCLGGSCHWSTTGDFEAVTFELDAQQRGEASRVYRLDFQDQSRVWREYDLYLWVEPIGSGWRLTAALRDIAANTSDRMTVEAPDLGHLAHVRLCPSPQFEGSRSFESCVELKGSATA